jgi:nitrite reductase/ring-hydroxylating ferredoxin subunit
MTTTGDAMRRDTENPHHADDNSACGDCPMVHSRRAFLRDIGVATAAALAAVALKGPTAAFAESVGEIAPLRANSREVSYAIPRANRVSVDVNNDVILARWENQLYAFSLKCPHKGERLEWRASEERVFCPKHKARFLAEGTHVSGRGKRDLDRHGLRRAGGAVVVDLGQVYRQDTDAAEWSAAVVTLD